jgi:hypothetical protein
MENIVINNLEAGIQELSTFGVSFLNNLINDHSPKRKLKRNIIKRREQPLVWFSEFVKPRIQIDPNFGNKFNN